MKREPDRHLPEGLGTVVDRLRDERPALSALELDGLRLRIRERGKGRLYRKEPILRSRIAIVLTLISGVFLTAGGAGLAATGPSGSWDAGIAQYGGGGDDDDGGGGDDNKRANDDDDDNDDGSNGDDRRGPPVQEVGGPPAGGPPGGGGQPDEQGTLDETTRPRGGVAPTGATAPATGGQRPRQLGATGQQLPFTGYSAIPIMVLGLLLLSLGLIAQRRLRTQADAE